MKKSDSRDGNAYALAREDDSNVHHSFGNTPTHSQKSQTARGIGHTQQNRRLDVSKRVVMGSGVVRR